MNKTELGASIASSVLIDLTNETRIANNESPLVKSTLLEQAASLKGKDMVKHGYFAHNSPDGVTPWYFFRKVGYTFLYAGENLAVNFLDSQEVINGWLNSDKHRANLLSIKFQEVGIATVEGVYEGNPTIFVVQMFGTPAELSPDSKTGTSSQQEVATSKEGDYISSEKDDSLKTFFIENNFIGVEANNLVRKVSNVYTQSISYSTWYEKLLFSGSRYIDYFYRFLAIFMGAALFSMVVVEIKRQHWKHILYGLLTIIVILISMYSNTRFF